MDMRIVILIAGIAVRKTEKGNLCLRKHLAPRATQHALIQRLQIKTAKP